MLSIGIINNEHRQHRLPLRTLLISRGAIPSETGLVLLRGRSQRSYWALIRCESFPTATIYQKAEDCVARYPNQGQAPMRLPANLHRLIMLDQQLGLTLLSASPRQINRSIWDRRNGLMPLSVIRHPHMKVLLFCRSMTPRFRQLMLESGASTSNATTHQ